MCSWLEVPTVHSSLPAELVPVSLATLGLVILYNLLRSVRQAAIHHNTASGETASCSWVTTDSERV